MKNNFSNENDFLVAKDSIEFYKELEISNAQKTNRSNKLLLDYRTNKNKDALKELISLNYKNIVTIANEYNKMYDLNIDDAIQEGILIAIDCIEKYSLSTKSTISTIIYIAVTRHLNRLVKKSSKEIHSNEIKHVIHVLDPLDIILKKEMIRGISDEIDNTKRINDRDKLIIEYRFKDEKTLKEISEIFNISHSRAKELKDKTMGKLRKNRNFKKYI